MEDAAELAVYYKDCPEEDVRTMTLRTLEVYVGRGARFSLIDREESGLDNIRLTSTYVRQMGGSHADLSTLTLRNGTTRNNYFITLAEEEADLRVSGFSLTSERMHTDNFSFIEHAVQLSEDALFYMRQRGIGLQEAKLMLSNAFAADVLKRIPEEELSEHLRTKVEERLRTLAGK